MNLNRTLAAIQAIGIMKPGDANRFAIIDRAVDCRGNIIKHCESLMHWVREIEDKLADKGVSLKDSAGGTSWRDNKGKANGDSSPEPKGMEKVRVPDASSIPGLDC